MTLVGIDPLEWLRERSASGEVHTVRLAWTDRLGTIRGKRLPVELFLGSPERRIGFCDGMIVVDVNCDVIQETPFSNFDTGYPDMYLSPRLETLAPVGWGSGEAMVFGQLQDHSGRPLGVAPTNVLPRVVTRLEGLGATVEARQSISGRLMKGPGDPFRLLPGGLGTGEEPPGLLRATLDGLRDSGIAVRSLETDRDGGFEISLDWAAPSVAANQAAVVKAAVKELGRDCGVEAVFMTVLPGLPGPSRLRSDLRLSGIEVDRDDLTLRLAAVRGILQPSVNALKAGPVDVPAPRAAEGTVNLDVGVSSEADPATALMAICAAIGAGTDGAKQPAAPEPEGLRGAADRLDGCAWARDWLGDEFVDNAVPLLRHEAGMFEAAVTDWEIGRYWSAS